MATYGKKKRPILSSFSFLGDASATSSSRKAKSNKRGSLTYGTSTARRSDSIPAPLSQDDSIEEMASMLLDDTIVDQCKDDPGKRLSQVQVPAAEVFTHRPAHPAPRQPFKTGPSHPMGTDLIEESEGAGVEIIRAKARGVGQATISPPMHSDIPQAKPSTADAGVNVVRKVEAMMAATKALKPSASEPVLQGPYLPTRKRRSKDGNVLLKMKTAINHRLQARSNKKSHVPARDDRFFGIALNDPHTADEDQATSLSPPALTNLEIRMNEGNNLQRPKTFDLTGHGHIRRKPLPGGGRSLQNLNTLSGLSPQALGSSSGGNQHEDGVPSGEETSTEPFPSYNRDYDTPFSSSPVAQSTPRIYLQPPFPEGGTVELHSLPDLDNSYVGGYYSDMDLDSPVTDKLSGDDSAATSQRLKKLKKKHPSPSKAELEGLETALRQYSAFRRSESPEDVEAEPESKATKLIPSIVLRPRSPGSALAPRNPNAKLKIPISKFNTGNGAGLYDILNDAAHEVSKPVDDDIDELQWEETALLKKG